MWDFNSVRERGNKREVEAGEEGSEEFFSGVGKVKGLSNCHVSCFFSTVIGL